MRTLIDTWTLALALGAALAIGAGPADAASRHDTAAANNAPLDPVTQTAAAVPDHPLRITTWNLEHLMNEAVFGQWVAACAPHGWDDATARAAGKPATLTYCDALSGQAWPCADHQESLALRTPEAYEKKVAALRARAAALDSDIYAFQEVSDADAVARILPPGAYRIYFVPAEVAMNVAFAVRKDLALGAAVRSLDDLSVCVPADRTDPKNPARCSPGSYRTRSGLELTLNLADRSIAFLNVHLKSGCRSYPVSDPPIASLTPRACAAPGYDQAQATAEFRESVAHSCALLRDQVPVIEAWVETQARAGNAFMVLGDFNRDFGNELRRGTPARLDDTSARDPILSTTKIGSILKEISDRDPDDTYLYLVRQDIEGGWHSCRTPGAQTYKVSSCHRGIDNFLVGKTWAETVGDNPKGLTAWGQDYGEHAYCADRARPSDHCPVTLEIGLPKARP